MAKNLILASGSPRRKNLLTVTGFEFQIIKSNYEEDMTIDMNPQDLVQFLALNKAKDVAKNNQGVILAADTFVVFNNKILGKPKDKEDAKKMLRILSGKTHQVMTGIAIIDTQTKNQSSKIVISDVTFRNLSDKDIENYVNTGEPMDKAGSYAVQTNNASLVENINGDYTSIIGLPIGKVIEELKKFDIIPNSTL